jgi:hypothetical protein
MNRVIVEKKSEFNAEARRLFEDLRDSLGLAGLDSLLLGKRPRKALSSMSFPGRAREGG